MLGHCAVGRRVELAQPRLRGMHRGVCYLFLLPISFSVLPCVVLLRHGLYFSHIMRKRACTGWSVIGIMPQLGHPIKSKEQLISEFL